MFEKVNCHCEKYRYSETTLLNNFMNPDFAPDPPSDDDISL